jgi:rRNA maturation protein Nop10
MKKCEKCGSVWLETLGDKCPSCGTGKPESYEVKHPQKETSQEKKKSQEKVVGIVIICILVLLVYWCSSGSHTTTSQQRAPANCYDLGFKYGRCATLTMKEKKCDPSDDIVIPERCRGMEETTRGIRDGTKSVW